MEVLISIVIEVGTISKIMVVFVIYLNIFTIMKNAVLICLNVENERFNKRKPREFFRACSLIFYL